MNTLETLMNTIESGRDEMVALQTLLTSIPALAPESNGEGELDKVTALEGWLKAHGITSLERYDAPDPRAKGGIRPNLIATIPGTSDDERVWVMAHTDVVPTGELSLWNTDPWKVTEKDGKLYGRGVEDDQQGLVSGVFAALSFLKNGVTPSHTIKLLFVADEEVGSKFGIQYLLKQDGLFKKDDLFIIPDGGDPEGVTIEVAEKSIMWLRVHTMGKQCHGSLPNEGANAHLANCDLALRINSLEQTLTARDDLFYPNYSTLQPTKHEPNVPNTNTIPGDDVFCVDCRILPCYKLDDIRAQVRAMADAVEAKYGVKIEITEDQAESSPATPVDAPVVTKLAAAINKAHGKTARTVGIGGGTVGGYLRNAGYHAAVWSTLDETCHQPNEYCVIKNMIDDAKTLAALMI